MRRWLTIALSGLVLTCQGPAAVMADETAMASRPQVGDASSIPEAVADRSR